MNRICKISLTTRKKVVLMIKNKLIISKQVHNYEN